MQQGQANVGTVSKHLFGGNVMCEMAWSQKWEMRRHLKKGIPHLQIKHVIQSYISKAGGQEEGDVYLNSLLCLCGGPPCM